MLVDTKDANNSISKVDSKVQKLTDKIGKGLIKAAKIGMAAIAAGATAAIGIGKQAVDQYAEYEQLVGGAQLMFGKAYDYISKKSKQAYKTVQMSQNEYLKQVNGFAVGLKTALSGNEKAAAQLADKILTAEADVVAATGNSKEAVQNAFNGIMKSNYTMLDNLQLGITPTKQGFQELIDKVNEWNAENGKATKYTIDNVADAQAALVDYIEMQGLSGYASREASQTIQGSIESVKAAYQNWLTALADDNANAQELTKNLFDSVETAANNLLPVVKTVGAAMFEVLFSEENIAKFTAGAADLVYGIVSGLLGYSSDDKAQSGTVEAGKNLANGIVKGIKQSFQDVDWWGLIWNEFKRQMGWNWISKAFEWNPDTSISGGMGTHGYHASGLTYVPYDGYTATLHRGERVVSAGQNERYSDNSDVITAIEALGNRIAAMQMVVDGETVIGYVDNGLGRRAASANRLSFA